MVQEPGDPVAVDEPLVELETDKVTIEVPAPAAGVLADIAAKDGQTVAVGALLGQITEGAASKTAPAPLGRPDQKTDTTAPINAAEEEPRPRPDPIEASSPEPHRRRRPACRPPLRCASSRPRAGSTFRPFPAPARTAA